MKIPSYIEIDFTPNEPKVIMVRFSKKHNRWHKFKVIDYKHGLSTALERAE